MKRVPPLPSSFRRKKQPNKKKKEKRIFGGLSETIGQTQGGRPTRARLVTTPCIVFCVRNTHTHLPRVQPGVGAHNSVQSDSAPPPRPFLSLENRAAQAAQRDIWANGVLLYDVRECAAVKGVSACVRAKTSSDLFET